MPRQNVTTTDGTTETEEEASHETVQEPEAGLDTFLGVLEYLSEATGLGIEDIADLLCSKEGPIGAMVLADHLQARAIRALEQTTKLQ
jgi:hypothetical protein